MNKKVLILLLLFFNQVTLSISQENLGWRRVIDKATFDISVNPLNPKTYYAGGEGRLIYRSYDGGYNWDTLIVNFRQGYSRLNNVLIHPIDTNIIIIGGLNFGIIERCTGDCHNPDNWKVVLSSHNPVALNGKSMVFKPDQPDTVYAGDFMYGILWRSTNKGETWDSLSTVKKWGKYEKSDGSIIDSLMPIRVGSIQIREDSTNVIIFGSTSSEVMVSQDGGYTWTYQQSLINPKLDQTDCEITRMVFSDKNPKVGYACITYIFLDNKNNGGLYKTTDGGYNWNAVAFPDTSIWALDCRGFENSEEVFIGGYTEDFYMVDSMRVPGAGIVRRSQDGGRTWWSYDPQMNWALRTPKANSDMKSVFFPNQDSGFAVGKYGVIMRSENSGQDWSTIFNPGYQNFTGAWFTDSKRGLLVASSGEIMRTTNGGVMLTEVYKDKNKAFHSINKVATKYFVSGAKGLIMLSADDGASWISKTSGTSENLNSIFFIDGKIGWTCGSNGTILATTDGGDNWTKQSTSTVRELHSIAFVDNVKGIAVGDSGAVLSTTDGGTTWIYNSEISKYNLYSVSFNKYGTNKELGLVCGDMGKAYLTNDGGQTWIPRNTKNNRPFFSAQVLSDLVFVAAGQYATIIQTQSAGEWWFVNQRGEGPVSNMWSLRYLGKKGQEKLYMATEAGLFVLDYPSQIKEINEAPQNSALRVFTSNDVIHLNYHIKSISSGQNLYFRLCDINGRVVYQNNFIKNNNTVFSTELYGIALSPGAYICQMIENDKSSIQIIIVE